MISFSRPSINRFFPPEKAELYLGERVIDIGDMVEYVVVGVRDYPQITLHRVGSTSTLKHTAHIGNLMPSRR